MAKQLWLIDGSYTFFRSYYAIRRLSNSAGMPTNAVYGFTSSLMGVLKKHRPDYILVAFDHPGPTFRDESFPQYKANREAPEEDLVVQIPWVKKVPGALNVPSLEMSGFEADDIIATLARRAARNGIDVVIAAADKDFMQLVSREKDDRRVGILMYDDRKGRMIGISEVREKFGVPPPGVTEVQGLMGDPTDNIPGVRGIGPKGAAELVSAYGTLEGIFDHLDELRPALKKKLETAREEAELSRSLATLRADVPIGLDWKDLVPGEPDREKALDLFGELEFTRFLEDLKVETGEPGETRSFSREGYRTILRKSDLKKFIARAKKAPLLSVDLETDSLDAMRANIVGIALAFQPGEAVYVPAAHRYLGAPEQIPLDETLSLLKPLLEGDRPGKVGQNLKYDALILRRYGLRVTPVACDTMVAAWLADPDAGPFGMDRLSLEHLGHETIKYGAVTGKGKQQVTFDQVPIDQATEYAAEDADVALRLVPVLQARMKDSGTARLWEEMERPLLDVLLDMEFHGVRLDAGALQEVSRDFAGRRRKLLSEIHEMAGREFNVDSPKQLQDVLFRDLKLPPGRKTKTGWSTDGAVLEKLAEEHPLPERILDYRSLSKLQSTYVDALPRMIHPETGRIHTSYNQAVAATGRLSSSDPNLQNIPVRHEEGRRIRAAFVPDPGYCFVSADYSQIELRVFAHYSRDPVFLETYRNNGDIHTATAAGIFDVDPDSVDAGMRRKAKEVNFGILYGMGAFGLSRRLKIPQGEAQSFIDRFFERFEGVRNFLERHIAEAEENGHVTTLFGRRRYVPELRSRNRPNRKQAERVAVNAPIQGTAADIIKVAMVRTARRLAQDLPDARMILQVHDELVLETPVGSAKGCRGILREEMEGAVSLDVPLRVDVMEGDRWSELK